MFIKLFSNVGGKLTFELIKMCIFGRSDTKLWKTIP